MEYATDTPYEGNATACSRCIIFYTCSVATRIDADQMSKCPRTIGGLAVHPDESDQGRWIATNTSERPLYVQQPSFSTTNVLELRPGLSCALVEGSRITSSQHSGWVNVSVR